MKLSEEEKKAIDYLENRLDILHNNTQWATEKSIKVVLNLTEKQRKEIEDFKNIKKEHQIMKRIILENGLWETLLKDDEFIKHLNEEN